ncbi:glycosyltransferase family 4 protein [Chryseobacterium sp. MFBS3-17]|uniref:glycosyltransferase family 4 protein n=1 Tax=Chryseobacterium sp. MFBS3-17 TaxID=2886689 RepID=UPI001D0E68D3|nr:glycosyltransferase family 4 protein [Chryseobacterium sp. MFBS3-17]MCC2591363.1 glycosyltransferase family 4 protein [Chryseobacterium sp. MFBS3-17]
MKILIGVTSYLSYKLIEGQINYLVNKGNEVCFVSSFNENTKDKVEKELGKYYPIEMEREINPIKDFISLIKIYFLLKKLKPDVINVSTPKAALLFTIISKLFFRNKIKTIFTLRGLRSDTLTGLKYRIVFLTEKITCYLADKIIVISPSLEQHAINKKLFSKSKSEVVLKGSSNGININKFRKVNNNLREVLKISEDTIVYGYVGRLVNDKGIRELFDAFQLLKAKHKNVKLLLIGSYNEADCIDKNLLNKIINDTSIILIDYTENIEEYYSIMDVFILFSYREGFGNVVIEAGLMEVPALVSNIPGLKDTIVDGETGFLVESKNVKSLVSKMDLLYKEKDLRLKFGQSSKERILNFFSHDKIWDGQLSIYKKLINK